MTHIERWVNVESNRRKHLDKHLNYYKRVSFNKAVEIYPSQSFSHSQDTAKQNNMSVCNQKSTEVKQEDLTQIGSNSKPVKDVKFDELMGIHKMNLTKTVNKAILYVTPSEGLDDNISIIESSKINTSDPEDRLGTKNLGSNDEVHKDQGPTDGVHRDPGSTKEVHKETITTTPKLLTQEQVRKEISTNQFKNKS